MVTIMDVDTTYAGWSQDHPAFLPMNKRRSNVQQDEDGVVVIGEDDPPKTFLRRILHWFGAVVLWLFALAPGLLIIAYGMSGIRNERLVGVGRYKSTSYGDNAIGWGWIFITLGFWALGQGWHLKTGRVFPKLLFNILAIGAFIVGIWVLFRRFVSNPS